jgi:hypothetical protein
MQLFADTFKMNKRLDIIAWIIQVLLIGLLLQSIVSKIVGAYNVKFIFDRVGLGGFGMSFSAIVEAFAILFLVVPRFFREGALLCLLLMAAGAFLQAAEVGVVVLNDGGLRFYSILTGFALSVALFFIRTHLAEVLYKKGRLD